MPRIPRIKAAMTPFPHSVAEQESLEDARRLMAEHRIHHLPVVDDQRLVGVLTTRDLDHAEATAVLAGEGERRRIGEIYCSPAYAVELEEPLDNVLVHMASERIGSAVVLRQGKVVGIFTTTDACRLFAEYLRRGFPESGDDAA